MKLKCLLAAVAAGVALASPWTATAYEYDGRSYYNDGTYTWRYSLYKEGDQTVAYIENACSSKGGKIAGDLVFPSSVTVTVTNELGYVNEDGKWITTRPRQIQTETFPVREINWYGFESETEDLTSVTIPEGVKYIYDFDEDCLKGLTAVAFPSSLVYIRNSFVDCEKLASVALPETCEVDASFTGSAWAKAMGDFFIWNQTLLAYQGTAKEVVVPDGVAVIGSGAFYEKDITSVALPSSLEEIGEEAFYGCANLASITLPKALSYIGYEAFYGDKALTSVVLPDRVSYLGNMAFGDCSKLASVSLGKGLVQMEYGVFSGTALTSIELPANLKYLGGDAFYGTAISSLTIPDGVEVLSSWTCDGMEKLTSVVLPSKVEFLDEGTFWCCSKLASVNIPASVKRIEYGTFANCASLARITGGEGLTSVAPDAFGYSDPTGVPFYDNAADGFRVLGPVAYGFKGTVPKNLTVPAGVKHVTNPNGKYGDNFFGDYPSDVESITFPDGVETVGRYAFAWLPGLKTVNLGNTVTNLGDYAFMDCVLLAKVTGGAALQCGADAFYDTPFYDNLWAKRGNADPFAFLGVGHVVFSYQGKAPADVVIPDDVTELGYVFDSDEDASVEKIASVTGGAGLRGHVPLYYLDNVKRIELTGPVASVDVDSNGKLEELVVRQAQTGEDDFYSYCINRGLVSLKKVVIGLHPEFVENGSVDYYYGFYGSMFSGYDKLESVEFVLPGHKLTGFKALVSNDCFEQYDILPNDLSTFKYIGYRGDFSESISSWADLYLYPQFQKALVDEASIDAFDPSVKSSYAGLLYDGEGRFAGSFEATVNKASKTKDGAVTIKIVPVNGKKETIKGTVDANGNGVGGAAGLTFGANGMTGTLAAVKNAATFSVDGATDATKAKNKTPLADFLNDLKNKAWGVVGMAYYTDSVVSDFANGNAALSVLMQAKGKAKIAGVLPNGTKVSVTSKIVVGDDKCAIPVVFSKAKESFGLVFWVNKDGEAIGVDGDANGIVWTGKDAARQPFSQTWNSFALGDALEPVVEPAVKIYGRSIPKALTGVLTDFLPYYEPFTVAGPKWTFAKATKVKYTKGVFDQAAFDKDVAAGKTNASGMKLTVGKKDGLFKGTCTIYSIDDKGKLKKNKVTINGVMLDGAGLGSGLIKKVGAMPVEIGTFYSAY